jgi:hypothetical protein
VTVIGAAFDSLIIVLSISLVTTLAAVAIVVWRGVLSGNLKKGTLWRKPLLVPSLVFAISLLVAMVYVPHPMAAYHGPNQINRYAPYQGTFTMYEAGAYEGEVQLRITGSLESNERLWVNFSFYQDGGTNSTLIIDVIDTDFDMNGGVTRSLSLTSGTNSVNISSILYVDDNPEQAYVNFLVNQAATSEFIGELTTWSTLRFVLGFGTFFLVLGGFCIDRGDPRKERKWNDKREGEEFRRRHTRWRS